MKNVKPILFLFLTVVLLQMFGCIGKKEDLPLASDARYEILSGANQTGIIGSFLPEKVRIRITRNGKVPANQYAAFAIFKITNCNETQMLKTPIDNNGVAEFTWRLDDNIGEQKLTGYVYLDDIPFDTFVVKTTALDYNKNIFNLASCLSLKEFALYNLFSADNKSIWAFPWMANQPYFSNNSGRAWRIVTDFKTTAQKFQVTKDGTIYWISNDTLFSSKDAGKTRQVKKAPELKQITPTKIQITNTGKILINGTDANNANTSLLSLDGGTSWIKPLGIEYISNFEELTNGRLFCTGFSLVPPQTNSFFYSDDQGRNWKAVWSNIGNNDQKLIYTDHLLLTSKNVLYALSKRNYIIMKTTDFGNSWIYIGQNLSSSFDLIKEYNDEFYYTNDTYPTNILKTTTFMDAQVAIKAPDTLYIHSFLFTSDNFILLSARNNVYYKPF